MFENYGSHDKNVINKNLFSLIFTIVFENLVQIGSLVTEIQILEKIYIQFYMNQFIPKNMANTEKNSSTKQFSF